MLIRPPGKRRLRVVSRNDGLGGEVRDARLVSKPRKLRIAGRDSIDSFHFDDFPRAAEQRSELSPGRGFARATI